MSGVVAVLLALASGLLLLVVARQAGWLLLRGRATAGELASEALAVAAGLALLAHAGFLLGLVGALRSILLPLLVVALLVRGRGELLALARALPGALRRTPRTALAAGALAVAAVVVMAVYPAAEFDETVYHLPMARAFAESGGLPVLPELRFPVFPALAEVLQAELWLLGGERATHAPAALATLAAAALLLGAGGSVSGPVAAAAWLGSPIVVYLAGTGYVEPLLALWALAAFVAVERWRRDGGAGWVALAGLFAGSASGAKYAGLLAVGCVAVEVLVAGRRNLRHLAVFAAAVLAATAPTYARIWLLTGNPLFPFYPEIFGSSPWAVHVGREGTARLAAAATSLFDAVARRGRLGGLPPFTPVLPLLAPLALLGPRNGLRWRCAAFAFLFVLLAPLHGHHLVTVVPALALAAALGIAPLIARRPRLAPTLAVLLLLPGPVYVASWVWRFGPPPVTAAGREGYVARRIPSYGALRELERQTGDGYAVYALQGEQLRYHARGRLLGEINGPAPYREMTAVAARPALLRDELVRLGATHLILPEAAAGAAGSAEWQRWFEPLHADGRARLYRVRR